MVLGSNSTTVGRRGGLMQCRGSRGRSLLCSKLWSLLHPPSGLRFRQHRFSSISKRKEPGTPCAASCPAQETPQRSTAVPPTGIGTSLEAPPKTFIRPGVSIDKRGQLHVFSREDAEKECCTALILSASSTNLTKADFTRPLRAINPPGGDGIEAAIPGRHARSLDRLPYWILLFKTPYLAACYQSRLRWYHQNAADNLPVNPLEVALIPGRGLTPPPGYIDPESGEDVWERLREYSLLQPVQSFSVTALLPEFPPSVNQAINRYKKWSEFEGVRFWTTRVRVASNQFQKDQISKFLKEDGKKRERRWEIMFGRSAKACRHDQPRRERPTAVTEESTDWHEAHKVQDFSIKFRSESEAKRFWRIWHRRPFPCRTENAAVPDPNAPTIHVELTW